MSTTVTPKRVLELVQTDEGRHVLSAAVSRACGWRPYTATRSGNRYWAKGDRSHPDAVHRGQSPPMHYPFYRPCDRDALLKLLRNYVMRLCRNAVLYLIWDNDRAWCVEVYDPSAAPHGCVAEVGHVHEGVALALALAAVGLLTED